jgi:ParB family chromosome partitioning protein
MNPSSPPKSRLQLVREQAARGELSAEVIPRTRLVVSIDRLVEDSDNERKSHFNLEELAASVMAHGIIEPITATALADGRYQILTGHRRYRAAKLAGLGQVEILIRQPEDSQRTRIKSLISNLQRENVPPLELASALQALITETGLTQDQVAAQLGKNKAWVSGVLRILDLPEEAKARIGCTQRRLSVDALTRIARLDNSDLQSQLVDAALTGRSQSEIRARIRLAGRTKTPKSGSTNKCEFRSRDGALVTVRVETGRLTEQRLVTALQEALDEARRTHPMSRARATENR